MKLFYVIGECFIVYSCGFFLNLILFSFTTAYTFYLFEIKVTSIRNDEEMLHFLWLKIFLMQAKVGRSCSKIKNA